MGLEDFEKTLLGPVGVGIVRPLIHLLLHAGNVRAEEIGQRGRPPVDARRIERRQEPIGARGFVSRRVAAERPVWRGVEAGRVSVVGQRCQIGARQGTITTWIDSTIHRSVG